LGGGAVFFELYSRGELEDKKAYLSDINSELINAYEVVKSTPEKLIIELEYYKNNHNCPVSPRCSSLSNMLRQLPP
jgi:DNA adenine methylase